MQFSQSLALGLLPLLAQGQRIPSVFGDHQWSTEETFFSLPDDVSFENATVRWDDYKPPTYAGALSIGSEEDLVSAVKLARAHDIPFLATGARHGFSDTLGDLDEGLAIDMSQLDSVVVDKSAGTVTVGPGVKIGNVWDKVFDAGYKMPTGVCSCVSFLGPTLGGGIGRLQGVNGLMIDALLSARIVLATGDVVEASADSNPDLFWAIRGAGHNFGIVASATYQLYPLRRMSTSVDLIFPARLNGSFFQAFSDFDISAKWAIFTSVSYNASASGPTIQANFVYHGPKDEALPVLEPIFAIGPIYTDISELPWNKLNTLSAFESDAQVCVKGGFKDTHAVNLRKRTPGPMVSAFNKLNTLYQSSPDETSKRSTMILEGWANEAVMAVPDNKTAYSWRDNQVYIMVIVNWTPGNDESKEMAIAVGQDIRYSLAATSGYDDLSVYINYARGDETLEQRYGERKLPRLAQLKKKYDPENVFGYYHPLPTSYP